MRRAKKRRISPSERRTSARVSDVRRGTAATDLSVSAATGRGDEALVALARDARARARCPYSRFRVGAAVRDARGRVFTGCNVESASFGLSLCAERVALVKAISEGADSLVEMAVASDVEKAVTPCGACRQVLVELAPGMRLVLAGSGKRRRRVTVRELLPLAFGRSDLSRAP